VTCAQIVLPDLRSSNGVVHGISRVLFPPPTFNNTMVVDQNLAAAMASDQPVAVPQQQPASTSGTGEPAAISSLAASGDGNGGAGGGSSGGTTGTTSTATNGAGSGSNAPSPATSNQTAASPSPANSSNTGSVQVTASSSAAAP
jgi:hypothetical protein